jgi:hypothetical protein
MVSLVQALSQSSIKSEAFLNVAGHPYIKKGYFVPVLAWEPSGMQ